MMFIRLDYIGFLVRIGDDAVITIVYRHQFLCNVQFVQGEANAFKLFQHVTDKHIAEMEANNGSLC